MYAAGGQAGPVLGGGAFGSVAEALRVGAVFADFLNSPAAAGPAGPRPGLRPGHIRRAVLLRDRTCAWPRCGRPAVYCDVHHLRHRQDGGETTLDNLVLVCQYHHDVCIHRQGWQLTLHPDGTTEARSPGRQTLYSHAPPNQNAA
jgi:HNH endonuclease